MKMRGEGQEILYNLLQDLHSKIYIRDKLETKNLMIIRI